VALRCGCGHSGGESEEIVGKALHGRRDEVVLATKVNFPMSPDPNTRGNSRRWIVREVEDSLRRLRTDYIDLYQIHRPDPDTELAFASGHPAVTSVIIGPRTMDQLTDLLAGATVALDDDVLDKIDRIVPPGVTLNAPDAGWLPPSLTDPAQRRRPASTRSAA
jgi:aryl-alcohol dehydrogenase-like predicted oxidoreductase